MPYIAVIVESPAKCATIEKYLGDEYKCMATYGHIRCLNHLKNVNIQNNFKPLFSDIETKKQQISKLRKFINGASEVLLAADDDREGEAIAWHVCDRFGLSIENTKRIIFHEITKTALENAVKMPTIVNMKIVMAQQARQILDLMVGFKLSPILWSKVSYKTKTGLSAGRCQTPALKIVYENQKDVDDSPGRKVYNTTGYFTSSNLPFQLDYNHNKENEMTDFLENSVNHEHSFDCGSVRNTSKSQPTPFTTSSLQQSASNELRISPKATMDACQKLYEAGFITYMRTDSTTYCAEFIANVSEYISGKFGSEYVRSDIDNMTERSEDNKKTKKQMKKDEQTPTAQEAHEAIRPTIITRQDANNIGKREHRVYSLILRNTLESCMSIATYNSITAKITAPNDKNYKYPTEQVVFPGWKAVAGVDKHNSEYHMLISLKPQVLPYKKITSKVTMKDLKSHLTEAKLVQLLEKKGIGRPSTFSSLIDKIQERGYVKKDNISGKKFDCIDFELEDDELSEITTSRDFGGEKNKLIIQPLGVIVTEFLIEHFGQLFEYNYTKSMEDTLDLISKGDYIWHELCRSCLDQIETLSAPLGSIDKQSIVIDEHNTYMIAKFGPVIKCSKNGKTTFKNVRDDIDIDKLRNKEYKLDDIIVSSKISKNGKQLGKINENEVVLYTGKYGHYAVYATKKYTIDIGKEYDEIDLDDIKIIIDSAPKSRKICGDASIRTGKYGHYIYYKTNVMKKPRFLHLKNFKEDYFLCPISVIIEWVKNTHKVQL